MNKRDFIKTSLAGIVGLMSLPVLAEKRNILLHRSGKFILPPLPYAYDALEPYIDKETMLIHHTKHHAAYTDKLNTALQEHKIETKSAREILENASKYNTGVINNGGGFFNHKIFWNMMSPNGGGEPTGDLAVAMDSNFGSFSTFKKKFSTAAKILPGSGWTWLIYQNGQLKVTTTSNHDNPLMDTLPAEERGFPLLCIDVWEHAYNTKYQDSRDTYIDQFWNIVNWDTVNKRLRKARS
jgi:Fe-Mn family superoxide dismutase